MGLKGLIAPDVGSKLLPIVGNSSLNRETINV